jgi:hypothetical protein
MLIKIKIKIIILTALIFLTFVSTVHAANFSFSEENRISVDSAYRLNVSLDTRNENINTIQAMLNFDPQFLEVVSIDTAQVFSFFPQKSFDNHAGTIDVVGALPSPGFSGVKEIFSINFVTKKTGETKITFAKGNKIMKDSDNTNIFESSKETSLQIVEKNGQEVKADTSEKSINKTVVYSFSDMLLILTIAILLTLFIAFSINIIILQRNIKKI